MNMIITNLQNKMAALKAQMDANRNNQSFYGYARQWTEVRKELELRLRNEARGCYLWQ